MGLPTLVFIGPAAACALSWLGIGSLIPRRALPTDALLVFLSRVAIGATTFAIASYVLGRLHLYTRPVLVSITAVGAAGGLVSLLPLLRRGQRPQLGSRSLAAVAGLVVAALILDVVAASVPPTSADGLTYHLALPKLWLEHGAIGDAFWNWLTFNPFGIEMLYGQGLAVAGGPTASAVGAVLAVLAAAAVYGLARELGGVAAGVAGAGLFVLQGLFTWEATSTFVELGLTFPLVLAVWFALRAARGGPSSEVVWAGAFAGAAAGTKYVGLQAWLLVVPLAALALRGRPRAALVATGAAAAAALTGGMWYLKNLLVAHNPVYPAGGGRWWTAASQRDVEQIRHLYGIGGTALRLFILPVDLLVHGGAFDRGQYVGTGIFVAALAALVVARTRETVVLLASAVAFAVSWWYAAPEARFLLPALAVLAAVGGAAVARLAAGGRAARAAVAVGVLLMALDWLAPSVALTRRALPVAFGAQSRAAYVQDQTGTYNALRAASARSHGVLALAGYSFLYYVDRPTLLLGDPQFAPDVPISVFRDRLRTERVSFLLDAQGAAASYPQLHGCLSLVATYAARMVTSRSLGESVPLDFRLYRLRAPCGGAG